MYGNEKQVGQAIAQSGLDRSEIFVTTKLNNDKHGYDDALAAFDQSLADLGLDQVDLFLIHWPLATVTDYVQTWRAMEQIYADGKARSIGVSNFQTASPAQAARRDRRAAGGQPDRAAPLPDPGGAARLRRRARHRHRGLVTDRPGRACWTTRPSPTIAAAHGRTPAQVVLRWHIQLGNIVFPKSVTPERIKENFEIFDFELSDSRTGHDLGAEPGRAHRTRPGRLRLHPR